MGIAPLALKQTYWDEFQINDDDLEFLYNYLLEKETPLTPDELVSILVNERIQREKIVLENKKKAAGPVYYPKDTYQVGQSIQFPQNDFGSGTVTAVRQANNPETTPFEVIDVEMDSGETRKFAAGLAEHKLNQALSVGADDPNLDTQHVLSQYGRNLTRILKGSPRRKPRFGAHCRALVPQGLAGGYQHRSPQPRGSYSRNGGWRPAVYTKSDGTIGPAG